MNKSSGRFQSRPVVVKLLCTNPQGNALQYELKKFFIPSKILENYSKNWVSKKLQWHLSNVLIPWCLPGSGHTSPPSFLKTVLFPYDFLPLMVSSKVHPFSPKVSPTYDMFPKNHMKYLPNKLYKFPVQGYVVIISVLCQTHIARISFLILLQLRCNTSINIWIVTFSLQLLQNS